MKKFNFKWSFNENFKKNFLFKNFKEKLSDFKKDSSWKIFFPISITFLNFTYNNKNYFEKITGASIINRFPLIIMIPICTKKISNRHVDKSFIIKNLKKFESLSLNLISKSSICDLNFIDKYKSKISNLDKLLLNNTNMKNSTISFNWKKKDLNQVKIIKLKSHSLIFLKIEKIFLNNFLNNCKIFWKSLPFFKKKINFKFKIKEKQAYHKNFTDKYQYVLNFKSPNFEKIKIKEDFTEVSLKKFSMKKIKKLSPDQSKWPIFFPSSVGIIGSIDNEKDINFMPCGSTTVVNRYPFQFSTAISHLDNNLRYKKRYSLKNILQNKKISLGIPYVSDGVLRMINYMGNISMVDYKNKINNVEFDIYNTQYGPIFSQLPITYCCELFKKVKFETHTLLIFNLKKVFYIKKFNLKKIYWNGLFDILK